MEGVMVDECRRLTSEWLWHLQRVTALQMHHFAPWNGNGNGSGNGSGVRVRVEMGVGMGVEMGVDMGLRVGNL